MWLVGLYLSRFGRPSPGNRRTPLPPVELNTDIWADAYEQFFEALGAGRTLSQFQNSLKNARDVFDAHVGSGRIGWREDSAATGSSSATEQRAPGRLVSDAEPTLTRWSDASQSEVWQEVRQYTRWRNQPSLTSTPQVERPKPGLTLDDVTVDPPQPARQSSPQPTPRKIDFDSIEEERAKLGRAGEEWVLQLERNTLIQMSRPDLAQRVQHTSVELGDGAGYDIKSFFSDGREKFIEVKTTRSGPRRAFLLTHNELLASTKHGASFCLYRVYNFGSHPLVYVISGPLEPALDLQPQVYRAYPNGSRAQTE
jgi:hypothetical protein